MLQVAGVTEIATGTAGYRRKTTKNRRDRFNRYSRRFFLVQVYQGTWWRRYDQVFYSAGIINCHVY